MMPRPRLAAALVASALAMLAAAPARAARPPDPPRAAASPLTASAHVVKSGKLVAFGFCGPTPAANGNYPLAAVTAVTATPTVYRGGQPVALGPPTWFAQTKDTPLVFYLLRCGAVRDIAIADGGAGYVSPTVAWNRDGGGTSLVLGTPVLKSGAITYVPVTSSSGDFTAPPTFTVTDAAATRPAVLSPIMTGAAPGDVLTYDAPAGWATAGGVAAPAVAGGAIDNWTGRLEGVSGGFGAFAQTPHLIAGVNVGSQPSNPGLPQFTAKNRLRSGGGWAANYGGGTPTVDPGGNLVSWPNPAGTVVSRWVHGTLGDNKLDAMGWPSQAGRWTLRHTDPAANTPAAMSLTLGAKPGVTPVNLSGPNVGTTNGVAIDPRDVVLRNGGVYVPVLANSTLGSGWQGAVAVVQGGGGKGAVLTVQVNPYTGTIVGLTTLCPGTGYTAPPTITVYGTSVVGTTATAVYSVAYPPAPTTWELDVALQVAAPAGPGGLGYMTATDVRVVAPDARTGAATPIAPNENPLALDDNVVRALTAGGKPPGIVRWMDATQGYAGNSNYVFASDIQDPLATSWNVQQTLQCRFQIARFFNADPAANYPWSSPRVYGPQSFFAEGPDGFSRYLTLPAADRGRFTFGGTGAHQNGVVELRSTVPHPFTTGQTLQLWCEPDGVAVPFTNATAPFAPTVLQGPIAWVTGPDTIVASLYFPNLIPASVPAGSMPQTVAAAGEIDLTAGGTRPGWWAGCSVPSGNNGVPYRYTAAASAQMPGSILWANLPAAATDDLDAEIAAQIAKEIGPKNRIFLELSNEVWNGAGGSLQWFRPLNALLGETSASGASSPFDVYGSYVPVAAHAYDVFTAAAARAGISPNRIDRVYGSWYAGPERTRQILETAQALGTRADHVAIAPYYDTPADAPIVAAFAPAGSRPDAGGWPVDAILDLVRHWVAYSTWHQGRWAGHAAACANVGQPLNPASDSWRWVASPTGGLLPAGTYYCCFTFEDAGGLETTVGLSRFGYPVAAGQVPGLVVPAVPGWAAKLNVYVGPQGSETLYATLTRADLAQYPPGSIYRLAAALPGSTRRPPATNLAARYAPPVPSLVCYEGGIDTLIPRPVPQQTRLLHDCFASPAYRDLVYGCHAAWQQGSQVVAGSGATHSAWYQLYAPPAYPTGWMLAYGPGQLPGDGRRNQYATIQGGWPADGRDHNGGTAANVSTALQGLLDWNAAVVPMPRPVPVPAAGLRAVLERGGH